jgi:hypothetical protein
MNAHRPVPLILAVVLLSIVALACGPLNLTTSTPDPDAVALAVQLTLQAQQASGVVPTGAPPTEMPPASEVAPPTEPPALPTPTVVHSLFPAAPAGTTSFMTDRSSAALAAERRSIADNFDVLLIERPFTANVMDYQGYLDINRAELSIGAPWIYVSIYLEAAPPAASTAAYGVEVDIDIDGRGDYLILGTSPASSDWSTNGVRILRDTNNDVGAAHPISADAPSGGNGYDELVFDQGLGADPDAAWIRLDPASSTRVQIAFKYAAIGSPDEWMWGAWADEGLIKPEWFDYNDHFTIAEAGSPTSGSSTYPIKAVASVDNSCRWAVGFTPVGDEPGICYIPPTPTPVLLGSISGRVLQGTGSVGHEWVPVTLHRGGCGGSVIGTVTTPTSGNYTFTGLTAGDYCVTVQDLHCDWTCTNPASKQIPVTLGAGENRTGVNFRGSDAPC